MTQKLRQKGVLGSFCLYLGVIGRASRQRSPPKEFLKGVNPQEINLKKAAKNT